MSGGKIRWAKKDEVDLVVPTMENAFSPLGNMIPFKSATKGQRVAMGSRMITQALPLTKGEAPLVQTGVPGQPGQSYESLYGDKLGAIRADQPARVMDVGPEGIRLRYADGREETKEIAHNFPYNRKTFFSQTPMVAAGDIVQPGQMLAKSNYVDDTGSAAMGLNARIAYMADGHNFEDAVSISQSFANKLQSEHMYSDRLDKSDDQKLGRSSYLGLFPSRFSRRQLDKIGDNGLVKPGTIVEPGDPLILAVQALLGEARAAERAPTVPVFGSDVAFRMVDFAQRNAERAGVADAVQLRGGDALQRMPPCDQPGVMLLNPPYGERIAAAGTAGRNASERAADRARIKKAAESADAMRAEAAGA